MEEQVYNFSNQAMGAIMMALQKGLLENIDITNMLREFQITFDEDGNLLVKNPPTVNVDT